MKPISDYKDYRLYIRDFYEERKMMTGLSWRGFNKMAGYASTKFLKLVCDGKFIENRTKESKNEVKLKLKNELENLVVQALDRLVSLSCIHYCTSTCDLSTS